MHKTQLVNRNPQNNRKESIIYDIIRCKNLLIPVLAACLCFLSGMQLNGQEVNFNYEWAENMGGTGADQGYGVAVDRNGNVYVTGGIAAAGAFFGKGENAERITSAGSYDAFLAKYAADGTYLWARRMGGSGYDIGYGVVVDGNDQVYVTGRFAAAGARFGSGADADTLTSAGGNDAFIAKYDVDGTLLWAKAMGGPDTDQAQRLGVDRDNNIYVTGYIGESGASFGSGANTGVITSAGNTDCFVAKYDAEGTFLWARSMGGPGIDQGCGLGVDSSGNVYVTGFFPAEGAYFGSGAGADTLQSAGWEDVFLAKYDTKGDYQWSASIGGAGGDYGWGIAADEEGNVYVTGHFEKEAYFGSGADADTIISAGNADVFLAKYDADGTYRWTNRIGGTGIDQSRDVAVDVKGNVYITGYFEGVADFGPSDHTETLTTMGNSDVFVARYDHGSGHCLWAKSMGGTGYDYSYGVAVDPGSNVYFAGFFPLAGAYFGSGSDLDTLTSAGSTDVFVAKLSPECALFPEISVNGFDLSTTTPFGTYQWLLEDEPIPGATDSVYAVTANGDYRVIVSADNVCVDTSDVYKVTNWKTTINAVGQMGKDIQVYPNPSNDRIYIKNAGSSSKIQLCSVDGRSLMRHSGVTEIAIADLADGLYLLRIFNQEGRLVKVEKINKQKK